MHLDIICWDREIFLGNHETQNYKEFVEKLLKTYGTYALIWVLRFIFYTSILMNFRIITVM